MSLLLLAALPCLAASKPKKNPPATAAAAEYVGSAACSRCHLEIANHFGHASMGHSLTAITPDFLKTLPLPAEFYDRNSGHHFSVHAEDGKLYQTEYQTGTDGKEIFRNTHPMEWIVGTGENGYGALLRRDGYLFQGPLSFYAKAARWELSPGYQNGDLSFNRIIQPGCIYCHSGRPQPVPGSPGKYAATPFTQTSVGCENCHGPGSVHVYSMGQGEEFAKGADPTIVNPAKLSGKLSDEICMSCHQTGDARVLMPGKNYQDYRPGTPLSNTLAIFQIPPTRENPPTDDHVEHYYSMTLSKCYRESAAGSNPMRCITCHDPHVEPSSAEASTFYNAKCQSCHAPGHESSPGRAIPACSAPQTLRQATTPADNCVGCHMPKRDVRVISHSSITNHRILARPDEPFPDLAFQQTTAGLPDMLFLDPSPVDHAAPSLLIRLQAYDILKAKKPEYNAAWLKTLAQLESAVPENAIVEASLGHRDLEARKIAEAVEHLEHSLRLDPAQPAVYTDLSEAADLRGDAEEAIAAAQKAVALDPFVPALQKTLIARLIAGKHYEQAQAAMESYLEKFPEDDFMRKMLAMAKE